MILWQMLNVENLGRVVNFTSVPGCGLSCQVSGVGHLFLDPATEGMSTYSMSNVMWIVLTKNEIGSVTNVWIVNEMD